MPWLIVTDAARMGLERCRAFLQSKNPDASARAARVIKHQLTRRAQYPDIGRKVNNETELREWLIPFGASGYVVLYRTDMTKDAVILLAFRHQKEAGY